jgi:hypothetical protein
VRQVTRTIASLPGGANMSQKGQLASATNVPTLE